MRSKVLVFQNRFLLGGQERQTVLHLATLDRSRWQPLVRCLRLEGEHLEDLARLGVAPRSLDVRKVFRPRTAWRVARLAVELRRERVALVHANDFHTNVLGTIAGRLAGVPVVVTRVDLGHVLDAPRRRALAVVSRAAARVIVNALAIRDACLADGVPAERIALVRNGVDVAAFDAAASRPGGAPDGAVVQVANMHHPVKGHEDLLRAMAGVLREVPGARLLLVGDGARRPELERLARELGIAEHVTFAGHRRDVPSLLARSAVAISASHAEGISNAVLEAMAARLPVVATAVGGNPELVRDGVSGFLVPPRSPAGLARRIVALLGEAALARRMGEAGRAVVEREFGVGQMRRRYEAVYEAVVAERTGGAP